MELSNLFKLSGKVARLMKQNGGSKSPQNQNANQSEFGAARIPKEASGTH